MRLPSYLFLYSLFFLPGLLSSCDILGAGPCIEGSGATRQEKRDVPSFKGIDVRIAGNITILHGPVAEIRIESFRNILPEIITEVTGNSLIIRSETCLEYADHDLEVVITMPEVDHLELKSAGRVSLQAIPSHSKLRISLSGSGNIRYVGSSNQMQVLNSGSGDIVLEGSTFHLETSLSGSGRIQGYFLHTDTAKVMSTGSGYHQIWVNKVLDATISGSGNVYYRGLPTTISSYISGSGKIINEN